jgi:hypothetical protein
MISHEPVYSMRKEWSIEDVKNIDNSLSFKQCVDVLLMSEDVSTSDGLSEIILKVKESE